MKKTIFIKNALILTVSSLILRFIGIIFKVWLAALIGSEGIGLYQLIFSVYVLASAFATTGISTAVTRLVAEELALGSKKGTLKILRRCIELTLIIAAVSIAVIFFCAEFIAVHIISDVRAVASLKILPFSLGFMGVTACIRGYFIARRNVTPNAVSQIFEQVVRILLIALLVKRFIPFGLEASCAAVMLGDVVAEIIGCFILFGVFIFDQKKLDKLSGRSRPPFKIVNKILHIAAPITSGRYLNTALRTVENILVPKNLSKYTLGGANALSQFGMIKGMALPVLFFPSTLLNSISTLLIPEIASALAKKRIQPVKDATENILRLTAIIGFVFSAIFFVGGEQIGLLVYKDADVGLLLKLLSPIVPLMYLDSISDGILKGLDQQLFSFRTAVSDSVIRIILILLILPKMGLMGFIGIMYFSNALTCILNVGRLIKVTAAKLKVCTEIFLPLLTAFFITILADTFTGNVTNNLVYIILLCGISIPLYVLMLFLFGIIKKEDILHIIR